MLNELKLTLVLKHLMLISVANNKFLTLNIRSFSLLLKVATYYHAKVVFICCSWLLRNILTTVLHYSLYHTLTSTSCMVITFMMVVQNEWLWLLKRDFLIEELLDSIPLGMKNVSEKWKQWKEYIYLLYFKRKLLGSGYLLDHLCFFLR